MPKLHCTTHYSCSEECWQLLLLHQHSTPQQKQEKKKKKTNNKAHTHTHTQKKKVMMPQHTIETLRHVNNSGLMAPTWRLLCGSFLVMIGFLVRDHDVLPKKQLHRSLQVQTSKRFSSNDSVVDFRRCRTVCINSSDPLLRKLPHIAPLP